ncbi:MAG TPA: DUF1850 domain-containing protein [bacterium]|nr:DUF1850 domain-containing protein [bacterium]
MRLVSIAVLLACAASLGRWAGPHPALRIHDESGLLLTTIGVPDGFTISYIHSINLTPVDEVFSIVDGMLRLDREIFEQLSTGMTSGDEDGFAVEDGKFVTRPRRLFTEIALRVSPVAGHVLDVGGLVRPLTVWAPISGLLFLRPSP